MLTQTDNDKNTPLHLAAEYNDNPDVIIALVEADANVNERDRNGNTPLHDAVKFIDNPGVINILLELGGGRQRT